LIAYLRTIYKHEFQKTQSKAFNVLLTKPKDIQFEIFVFTKYLELMRNLSINKEKTGTLEEDLASLDNRNMTYTKRFGIIYRIEKKKILRSQIDLCEFILSILSKI
jgi:hypothetical protein